MDQIYRTRANFEFCQKNAIRISGPKLVRPSSDAKANKKEVETMAKDRADRIEIECCFSVAKRRNGMGLISKKRTDTSLFTIGLAEKGNNVSVKNFFSVKIKKIFIDEVWCFAGLTLMNVVAQFVVYPFWDYFFGSEGYGNIIYLMAILNTIAISIGSGINYARIQNSIGKETGNRLYLLLMIISTVIAVVVLFLLYVTGFLYLDDNTFILFCVLTIATMWRYYADIEFRLHVNYKGFFLYYFIISIGYLIGALIFFFTKLWPLTLLPGELMGLLYVIGKGSVFGKRKDEDVEEFYPVFKLSFLLVTSTLLSHLIFNGDKMILRVFMGDTAVTFFYIASLFGKAMTLLSTSLNGVLIGHLAKYNGKLTYKFMQRVVLISLVAIILSSIICNYVSHVILPFLYPTEFEKIKQYLLVANAAQIVYFIGNILQVTVLLRFTNPSNQLFVDMTHGIFFLAACIPVAKFFDLSVFCWCLMCVNAFRFILCIVIGYKSVARETSKV